jgi:uncharacterized protein (TIGR01777 family)
MKIVIAGGTGFLGGPLAAALGGAGHTPVILSRRAGGPDAPFRTVAWTPDGSAGAWAAELSGAGAVVNLAGESIAARRWTAAQKQRVLQSRVRATASLVAAIARAAEPPPTFISGSAVGYYGSRDNREVAEDAAPGHDFLASVCVRWESEAMLAVSARTRVVCLRTGLVLARDGGALSGMLLPFWLGVGGPVGSGRQYWPWIHRQDWIELVRFAIETPTASGAMNATAPNPVTSREFAEALGRAMHRPSLLPAPGFALKLLLGGEMAEGLLLSGQRVIPAKAVRLGYRFQYASLAAALADLFKS